MKEIDRISELATFVVDRIPGLIDEQRDAINEAITASVEAAQEDPDGRKGASLTLTVGIKWDLDSNKVEVSLPVSIKKKAMVSGELSDPNQPEFPEVTE